MVTPGTRACTSKQYGRRVDEVQRAYSRWSRPYIDALGSLDSVDPQDLAFIARHLGTASDPVLDLGCGPGHLSGYLHSLGRDVTGLDLVPEFVAHARAAYPDVDFAVGSLVELVRPDASVAGVLVWFSLIHLDDLDAALHEIRRVLVTGGALVAGFFTGPVHETFDHRVVTAHRYPVEELVERCAQAGLVVADREHRVQESNQRPYVALAGRAG